VTAAGKTGRMPDAVPTEGYLWTQERRDLQGLIKERSPELAGIYGLSISLLSTPATEGEDRARLAIICHGMRELANGVPFVLAEEFVTRSGVSASDLVQELPAAAADQPAIDLSGELAYVVVPRELAERLVGLIDVAKSEEAQSNENAALLITRSGDLNSPAVKQWQRAKRFFVKWAHWDRKSAADAELREIPCDGSVIEQVIVVEDFIRVRLAGFFESRRALVGIVGNFNAPPTDEETE
jgi:hypothetical protein